jgi:hypothetical protein
MQGQAGCCREFRMLPLVQAEAILLRARPMTGQSCEELCHLPSHYVESALPVSMSCAGAPAWHLRFPCASTQQCAFLHSEQHAACALCDWQCYCVGRTQLISHQMHEMSTMAALHCMGSPGHCLHLQVISGCQVSWNGSLVAQAASLASGRSRSTGDVRRAPSPEPRHVISALRWTTCTLDSMQTNKAVLSLTLLLAIHPARKCLCATNNVCAKCEMICYSISISFFYALPSPGPT